MKTLVIGMKRKAKDWKGRAWIIRCRIWVWGGEGKGILNVCQMPSLGDLDGFQSPRWIIKKQQLV